MHRFREPVNGFTHLGGVVFGVMGLTLLVILTRDEPGKMLSMIVYGMSLILLYSASTAYHLIKASDRVTQWLRRFDHAAIYLLIAGTYTPIAYHYLAGTWRWGMLGVVWLMAVVGVVHKLFFLGGKGRGKNYLSTLLYVGMGWMAVLLAPKILERIPPGAILLIVLGGLTYTGGAIIYALEKPNFHRNFGHHEIWHLFVLGASAFHFMAILVYVA